MAKKEIKKYSVEPRRPDEDFETYTNRVYDTMLSRQRKFDKLAKKKSNIVTVVFQDVYQRDNFVENILGLEPKSEEYQFITGEQFYDIVDGEDGK